MKTNLSTRYSAIYGGFFLTAGIMLPFWPLWLESRGLGSLQIGLILALGPWMRVFSNPLIAQVADRSGRPKLILVILSALSLIAFISFLPAESFPYILCVSILAAICFPAMLPIAESQVMSSVIKYSLDYGRIRLWGSLTFIIGTLGTGFLIGKNNPDFILILIIFALLLTLLAALIFPREVKERGIYPKNAIVSILLQPRFILFVISASLLQASHAVYNGFSTLHWKESGIKEQLIGALWVEGVFAEILLFSISGFLIARIGPIKLLAIAGVCGLVRWTVLAQSTDIYALLSTQVLHALTFGAVHLGAMHFIASNAPAGRTATAQGIYTSISGLIMGLAMVGAGSLYELFRGQAFYAMVLISALGLIMTLILWLQDIKTRK
ncbi:MAG: MFS transporter [Rhodospirillaceae bacterium]|mgnify:CR=1 FL=1|nr:MFS transporter [Rhodospirillaceae bacterium]|tara:strand:- start:313 stop:1458 length:1146 start_codon:yes stop_codon:yes gene_type:complete